MDVARVHRDRSRARCRRPRGRVPRVGLDRGRAATTRARSASCRSSAGRSARARSATSWPRCRASRAQGVVEVTLLGQNVNTYGRDVTVPGSSRRPLFADLLRAVNEVDGLRRIRFTSPHPHDFTPDVIEAMAESDNGLRAHPLPAAVGLGPRAEGDAALVPARALPRAGSSGSAPRSRTSPCRTDIIVGFPGETEEDFARHARGRRAGAVRPARTRSSTRPGRGRAPPTMDEQVAEGGRPGAVRPAGRAPGARSRSSGCASRSGRRPRCCRGRRQQGRRRRRRARGRTGSCTSAASTRPGRSLDARIVGAAPAPPGRRARARRQPAAVG